MASARSSRQFARAFGLRLRVLIGGSKHYRSLEMINLDRHRATSSAPRTQQLDEVHHERLEICRPISSRRSHPVSRPKRTRLELVCEALESRQLLSTTASSTPDLSQIVAQTDLAGPSAGRFRADRLYPAADPERLRSEPDQVLGRKGCRQRCGTDHRHRHAYNDPNIKSDLATFDTRVRPVRSSPPSRSTTWARPQPTRAGRWRRRSTSSGPTPWLPEPISFWSKLLRPAFPPCSVQSITPEINRVSASSR